MTTISCGGPYIAREVHDSVVAFLQDRLKQLEAEAARAKGDVYIGSELARGDCGSSNVVDKASISGRPLPPCPKCGGEPMVRTEERGEKLHYMQCHNCGMKTNRYMWQYKVIKEWCKMCEPAAVESAPISPEVPQRSIRLGDPVRILIGQDRGKIGVVESIHRTDGVTVYVSGRFPNVTYWPKELQIASAQAHGLTPLATPSAAVCASGPGCGDKLRPEVGKRYVRRDGKVSGALRVTPSTHTNHEEFPLFDFDNAVSYDIAGGCDPFVQLMEDLIAEYHEPKPSPPAESPDDWVMITNPKHVIRNHIDHFAYNKSGDWREVSYADGVCTVGYYSGNRLFRCRRKDLPVVPVDSHAPQPSCSPVCALCGNLATCFGQYADHDKGFACDSCCGHGNEDGWCMPVVPVKSPAMPSPWRPMTENPTWFSWIWVAAKDSHQVCMSFANEDDWPMTQVAAWMPIEKPQHPNSAPSDKPRMRQVTLKSYEMHGDVVWTSASWIRGGRAAVVEVPE